MSELPIGIGRGHSQRRGCLDTAPKRLHVSAQFGIVHGFNYLCVRKPGRGIVFAHLSKDDPAHPSDRYAARSR